MGWLLRLMVLFGLLLQSVNANSRFNSGLESDDESFTQQESDSSDSGDVTFSSILSRSMETVLGNGIDTDTIKKVLEDHYFTADRSQSIWPIAITETETNLNLTFNKRELSDMSNDIKSIYKRMLKCDLLLLAGNSGKSEKSKELMEQAKCYSTLNEFVDGGFTDFGFPRGSMEGQAKKLQIGLAYSVMSILLLQMTRQMTSNVNISPKVTMQSDKSIIDIAENVFNFKTATKNTVEARLQAISPTEICETQEVLWQQFEVACEVRAKRSRRDVNTAAGIGGSSNKFEQIYRAKVVDNVTGKYACNQIMVTSKQNSREEVKAQLTKTCDSIRAEYLKEKKKEIEKFYKDRTLAIVDSVKKLWQASKKMLKASKVSANNYLIY